MIGILIGIVCLEVMGISLICGKGSWMISGYNTMSKEEKANCNIKKISRAVGIFLSIVGVLMAIMAVITDYAEKNNLKNIVLYAVLIFGLVIIIGCVILIIYCQKHNNNK